MGSYRIMRIASQARRAHSGRGTRPAAPCQTPACRQTALPALAQVAIVALIALSLAAIHAAKAAFHAAGDVPPLAVTLALAALMAAGLVASGARAALPAGARRPPSGLTGGTGVAG